ncbi:MAG: hypothetical protein EAZ87_18990 [Nostocales cyanobacterium]|nr:MAG: hypothetical protein EAZ87_18990 [Nostocales cyanobacterium]
MLITSEKQHQNIDKLVFIDQKLRKLDLNPIAYKLIDSGWNHEQTVRGIAQYMMFLSLIHLYPNLSLVPSSEIDQVWHFHILDTAKYAQDCQMLFGYFVHHFPYWGIENTEDREIAFMQTQQLLAKHFTTEVFDQSQTLSACKLIIHEELQRPSCDISAAYSLLS